MIGGWLYMRRNGLELIYNKQMWAVLSVSFCLTMISGHMWNKIRGPPFFHKTKDGPIYIKGGTRGQFIYESYIVAVLNAAVVVSMIIMIEAAGRVRREARAVDGKKQCFQIVAGLVLLCVFFSLLLSVYRAKNKGYPYSFLFE